LGLTPLRRIPVKSTTGLGVGDHVVIATRLSREFIDGVQMTGIWQEDDPSIRGVAFSRTITQIEPGAIIVDTPVRFYLKTRDDARVYRTSPIIENSGIEDLSIGNLQHGGTGFDMEDFNRPGTAAHDVHSSRFIDIHRARNVWLKNVATYKPAQNSKNVHVLSNGVSVRDASHVTLKNVRVARPEYLGEGGNGYGFQLAGAGDPPAGLHSQLYAKRRGIGGMQCSGNVLHRCRIEHSKRLPTAAAATFTGS
jgi:hypothetical protein